MTENRVDPTVAGLFLTAFIVLVFGFIGILTGAKNDMATGLQGATLLILVPMGILFMVLTVSAIKCGNAFAAALFAFVAIALFAAKYGLEIFADAAPAFENTFMIFFLVGIFFILFTLVAFLIGAPKLLAIMLLFVGLVYIFVGIFVNAMYGWMDGGFVGDAPTSLAYIFGICGIIGGALATYLGLALSTQKFPVF